MYIKRQIKLTATFLATTIVAIVALSEAAFGAGQVAQAARQQRNRDVAAHGATVAGHVATATNLQKFKTNIMAPAIALGGGTEIDTTLGHIIAGGGAIPGGGGAYVAAVAGDAAHGLLHGTPEERLAAITAIEASAVGGRPADDLAKQGIRAALGIDATAGNLAATHPEVQAFITIAKNDELFRSLRATIAAAPNIVSPVAGGGPVALPHHYGANPDNTQLIREYGEAMYILGQNDEAGGRHATAAPGAHGRVPNTALNDWTIDHLHIR